MVASHKSGVLPLGWTSIHWPQRSPRTTGSVDKIHLFPFPRVKLTRQPFAVSPAGHIWKLHWEEEDSLSLHKLPGYGVWESQRISLIRKSGTVIHLINLPDKLQQQLRSWSCPEEQDCSCCRRGSCKSTTVVSGLATLPPRWPSGQEWRPSRGSWATGIQ